VVIHGRDGKIQDKDSYGKYMRYCKDEDTIRRFSGKTLLRIAGLESDRQRQEAISELMGELEHSACCQGS
jgi:hypothetical protein